MTPGDAAKWLAAEIRGGSYVDHAEVISHLEGHTGLTDYNEAGNLVVSKAVLREFRKLNAPDIVWSRSGQHWRLREGGDPTGRLVD